jgi:gas vesicle protein
MSAKRNLLIGVGIGAVIGILFAPHKGSKTRKNIAKRGADLREGWNNLKETASETFSKNSDYLEEGIQSMAYSNSTVEDNWKD